MLSAAARMRRRVRSSGGTEPAVHRAVFGDVDVFVIGDGDRWGEELAEVGEDPAGVFPRTQELLAELRPLEDAHSGATFAALGSPKG